MINRKNRLPMRNAAGIELVGVAHQTDELGQPERREVGGCLPLRGPAHLDQGNMGQLETHGKDKTFRRLF
jgi:hypothetical protein